MATVVLPNHAEDTHPKFGAGHRDAPILVASDGTDASRPALEVALELSARRRSPVRIVAVVSHVPVVPLDFGIVVAPPEDVDAVRDTLLLRVKEQLVEVAGTRAEWPIDVRWGDPAVEIARTAKDINSSLIVLGVEHRSMAHRLLAQETAVALLRLTRVPLLVIPGGFRRVPRRITVATDFSQTSVAAAEKALELFPSIRDIDLAHVSPGLAVVSAPGSVDWFLPARSSVNLGFEIARAELEKTTKAAISTTTLRGNRAKELTGFARATAADVLVMGSRGVGLLERLLVGSTSRPVLREAPCAALVVHPESDTDGPFALLRPHRETVPRERWSQEIDAFSSRNAGRQVSIEVVGALVGSKVQDRDVRFVGAAWDPHDHRLEIMTEVSPGSLRHHSRNIANVRTVEFLRDRNGGDWIFRVTNGETQTILTLSRHQ